MKKVTVNLYSFNELSEKVQEKLIQDNRDHETEHCDWYSPIVEGFEEDLENVGFEDITTGFTGFWSQGDGACFHGDVYDNEKFIETLKTNEYLEDSWGQEDSIDNLELSIIKTSNHYEHENTITGNVDANGSFISNLDELEAAMTKWARDKSRDLYKKLEKYYEELTSDEFVTEYLVEQGEVFLDNGKRL